MDDDLPKQAWDAAYRHAMRDEWRDKAKRFDAMVDEYDKARADACELQARLDAVIRECENTLNTPDCHIAEYVYATCFRDLAKGTNHA